VYLSLVLIIKELTDTMTGKESPPFSKASMLNYHISDSLTLHHSVLMYYKKIDFHLMRRWKVERNDVNVRSLNIKRYSEQSIITWQ
jgi:hypothetical protein